MQRLPVVKSMEDLSSLVVEIGFLPYFKNEIRGFSLEECLDGRYWFPEEGDGAWEWKGPVIACTGSAYGKFFHGKAGYISREWFPSFVSMRRQGYGISELHDTGRIRYDDYNVWRLLDERGALVKGELKTLAGYSRGGKKGFEGTMTRLQMQTFVLIGDFPYAIDRNGNTYGWGMAQYETPENHFGTAFTGKVENLDSSEEEERIVRYLGKLFPDLDRNAITHFLSGGVLR